MKKTIATVAMIAASSSSFALMQLPSNQKPTTLCVQMASAQDGSKYIGTCDESDNNVTLKKKIAVNGCAAGQAAIVTYGKLNIGKCMPAGAVQL